MANGIKVQPNRESKKLEIIEVSYRDSLQNLSRDQNQGSDL